MKHNYSSAIFTQSVVNEWWCVFISGGQQVHTGLSLLGAADSRTDGQRERDRERKFIRIS